MAQYEVDDTNYKAVIQAELDKEKIVILKFGSDFCEACSALDMELEQLEEMNDNLSIILINCDEYPEIAEAYDIYKLPTMIIFENKNSILYEAEGVVLCEDIQKVLDSKL
jgi:thioredoxin 1